MTFTVAVIGRPNVGKSTLFNRLVGRRLAIVDDTPGVTRDRREGEGRIADLSFRIIDTAGLEDAKGQTMEARMRAQTELAVRQADAVLFLIDARQGVTPVDKHFAAELRRSGKPIILLANKCEGRAGAAGLAEAYALGLGEPLAFSAEHGEGLSELYDALQEICETAEQDEPGTAEEDDEAEEAAEAESAVAGRQKLAPLKLAVVGRPNVGKSTLANSLLGEERLLTGPEAGLTRDAIAVEWSWRDRPIRLVDTAGLRRQARVQAKLEKLSVADTLRVIRMAEVVVLMIDATQPLERQDLNIAAHVVDEGRVLVVAANKWDLVKNRQTTMKAIRDRLDISLPQARGVSVVPVSALTGRGSDALLEQVFRTYEIWNQRVQTGVLNRWLADMVSHHPPPLVRGRRLKVRYMTQVNTRPPTFAVFVSQRGGLPEAYARYLVNGLRDDFGLDGVPVRLFARAGENPYDKSR
jgi:GTP-binding protein